MSLVIGGFIPLTTIDFPDHLSAVVFLQGCPWRCRYCQNVSLLAKNSRSPLDWEFVLQQLQQRRGFLDAVVFSGGEPTWQSGLTGAMDQVKAMGFKVGLHTGGMFPDRLQAVLARVDWVALDVKAAFDDYAALTRAAGSAENVRQSIRIIREAEIPCEFRTTVHPDLLGPEQLQQLFEDVSGEGIEALCLQNCVASRCLDKRLRQPVNRYPLELAIAGFAHENLRVSLR